MHSIKFPSLFFVRQVRLSCTFSPLAVSADRRVIKTVQLNKSNAGVIPQNCAADGEPRLEDTTPRQACLEDCASLRVKYSAMLAKIENKPEAVTNENCVELMRDFAIWRTTQELGYNENGCGAVV